MARSDRPAAGSEAQKPKEARPRRSQWFDATYYRDAIVDALKDGALPIHSEFADYFLGEAELVDMGKGRPIPSTILRYIADLLRTHPNIAPKGGRPSRRPFAAQRGRWQAVGTYPRMLERMQEINKAAKRGKSPEQIAELFEEKVEDVRRWIEDLKHLTASETAYVEQERRYAWRAAKGLRGFGEKAIRAAVTKARKQRKTPLITPE